MTLALGYKASTTSMFLASLIGLKSPLLALQSTQNHYAFYCYFRLLACCRICGSLSNGEAGSQLEWVPLRETQKAN